MKPKVKITKDRLGRYEVFYNGELIMERPSDFKMGTTDSILKLLDRNNVIDYEFENITY